MKKTLIFSGLLAHIRNKNLSLEFSAKSVTPLAINATVDPCLAVMVFRKQASAEHAFSVPDVT